MKKRYLLIIFCTLIISIFSVGLTVTFMTDRKKDENVFTIGSVSIALTESKVDELGNVIGNEKSNNNTYHLMPGYTYTKDPTIIVEEGSEDSYVRILVTINSIVELKGLYGEDFVLEDIYSNWGIKWILTNKKTNSDGTITFEYRYKDVVNGLNGEKKLEPLFTNFTIPASATVGELENLANYKIIIKGQAIQKSGFTTDKEAWQAFEKQYNE